MSFASWLWHVAKKSLIVTPVALTFTDSVASMCGVEGRSMQPTLNPDGFRLTDCVLLDKLSVRHFKWQRGDVVTLRSPSEPNICLVKRLIGLPGDWIRVPGHNVVSIPDGHCWVEGDNEHLSCDSKNFGPVPLALLEGRVTFVVWPPSRVGRVESRLPERRLLER